MTFLLALVFTIAVGAVGAAVLLGVLWTGERLWQWRSSRRGRP